MTDSMGLYTGTFHPKRLTKKEREKMKKIMKTVPIVEAKNSLNHEREAQEADKEFVEKLSTLDV